MYSVGCLFNLVFVYLLVHPVYLLVFVVCWPIFFLGPFFSLYPERSMQLAYPVFLPPSPYLPLLSFAAVFTRRGCYFGLC